jgi:endonuclease G
MKTRIPLTLVAAACALVLAACDARAPLPGQAQAPATASTAPVTGFAQCRQFFPGELPRVPDLQARQLRDLCYDAFAVLHSGRTKTPVFVVEKLTAAQLADAADEERTNKFFADARLPSAERATLDDYKGSGFDRGHMQYPVDFVLNIGFASEGVLSRSTQSIYSLPAASARA